MSSVHVTRRSEIGDATLAVEPGRAGGAVDGGGVVGGALEADLAQLVPVAATTGAAGHEVAEAAAKLLAEEAVDDGIHAGVGAAQPLCQRHYDVVQHALRVVGHRGLRQAPELQGVQRHPGEGEEGAHHSQHLDYLHLGAVDELGAAVVGSQRVASPHLDTDEGVADDDHGEGHGVAGDEDDAHVVASVQREGRPLLVTHEQLLRTGTEQQVVVEDKPGHHDAQRRQPDEEQDDPAGALADLQVHRVADGKIPAKTRRNLDAYHKLCNSNGENEYYWTTSM